MTTSTTSDRRPQMAGWDATVRAEPSQPASTAGSVTLRSREIAGRLRTAVRAEALLIAVLAGSFLTRWLIADRNSYWLDEILSVTVYGVYNDSAGEMVRELAAHSIHPPLYQFILYYWLDWFGDGERAARSLSNLFITLATLFVYLMMRNAFSRRLALASAIGFALMYAPTFYALEARSYAQTIFLVTLSSYCLLRMMRLGATRDWLRALTSPSAAVFMGTNVALLLTHYFNFFFWAAQAIIVGVFVLRELPPRSWLPGLGTVLTMYAVQAGIFALIWGEAMTRDVRRKVAADAVEGEVRDPLSMLASVVRPNLDPPAPVWWIGLALVAAVVVWSLVTIARRGGLTAERRSAWTVAYLAGWLLLPILVAYIGFLFAGAARDAARYWLFVVPALAPMVVLAVEAAVRLAGGGWRRLRGVGLGTGWATLGMAVVVVTLIVPGTLAAATQPKADYRGIAQDVVAVVEGNPESSYLIYETSFGRSYLGYYLDRYGDGVEVADTLTRRSERTGDYVFERQADEIAQYDFLILAVVYHRTSNFPVALQRLRETYRIQHWQIDDTGQGLIVFAVSPSASREESP